MNEPKHTMTDDEKRARIRELCGWRLEHIDRYQRYYCHRTESYIGDPLTSLDAMAAAEATLTEEERWDYLGELAFICESQFKKTGKRDNRSAALATARQRAEAFLRVKGALQ